MPELTCNEPIVLLFSYLGKKNIFYDSEMGTGDWHRMTMLYEEEFYDISICQRYINLSTMFRLHVGLERNTLKGIFIGISLLKSITVPFSRREKKRKIPIFKSLTYRWGLEMQLTNVHCCIYTM